MTVERSTGDMRNTRPEEKLLIYCASTSMDPGRASQIMALLENDIDWKYLLWIAIQHRMLPLLFWHLDSLCPQAIPKDIMGWLQENFQSNLCLNLLLIGDLIKFVDLCAAHDLPVIPYKGPTLAAAAYGNPALRQAGDLDVLVRKGDVQKARELAVSQGYMPEHQVNNSQEPILVHCHYCHYREDTKTRLEIHWQFLPKFFPFPLNISQLLDRLEPTSIGGREILTLSPEDLLLILCVHGSKHLWTQLRWVCDVAELIRAHREMDWERIMDQTRASGCERMFLLGLLMAGDLLGVTLPQIALRRIYTQPSVKSIANQMRSRLFLDEQTQFRDGILRIKMTERLQSKFRYCLYVAAHMAFDR